MAMDDVAGQLKKVSPFPRRRVDLERVWLVLSATMAIDNVPELFIWKKKKYHHSRNDESTWNGCWLVPLATMAIDDSHELVYFNPSLDSKISIAVPTSTS
jgi:hypothetical protein